MRPAIFPLEVERICYLLLTGTEKSEHDTSGPTETTDPGPRRVEEICTRGLIVWLVREIFCLDPCGSRAQGGAI